MNEKIEVLGIGIDNLTAKEAMQSVVSYMETEQLNVIEMVTMNTLGKFQQEEQTKEIFDNFDIALAGDKGILQAVGVEEERRLSEVEELLFVKMVMRFLHKNETKVFLLSENEADLQKLETYMEEDYSKIQVVEKATMNAEGNSEDLLLNLINGAEVDCVLSTLLSPTEEQFVFKNKTLVCTKLWFGFGNLLDEMKRQKNGFHKVKEFVLRQILKKEMAKKGENA